LQTPIGVFGRATIARLQSDFGVVLRSLVRADGKNRQNIERVVYRRSRRRLQALRMRIFGR